MDEMQLGRKVGFRMGTIEDLNEGDTNWVLTGDTEDGFSLTFGTGKGGADRENVESTVDCSVGIRLVEML